jgi:hypothetical protein
MQSTSAIDDIDGRPRPLRQRMLDAWFAPKDFESARLYERMGVLLLKQYVPTGGDLFARRYGVHIADIRPDLDSLVKFERLTRRLEAIHEIVFLGFVAFSLRRAIVRKIGALHLGFEIAVYLLLILSPAILQRYNRLRIYPVIRRMARTLSSQSAFVGASRRRAS